MTNYNPFGITINSGSLELLKKLQPNEDGVSADVKYSDVLKPDADGMVTIGTQKVEHALVAGALDGQVRAPKGAIKSLLSTADRLAVIQTNIQKQTEKLNVSIERNARKEITKSPAGKSALQMAELAEMIGDTRLFNNPLDVPSSVHRTRTAAGSWIQLRLAASAVTTVAPSETRDEAVNRLKASVVNDRENLLNIAGLKLNDKNLSLVGQAIRESKAVLPEGQVGIIVGYSLTFDDTAKAKRVLTKLNEASQSGVQHILNVATTDSETLRLNLSPAELLDELEEQTGVDPEAEVTVEADTEENEPLVADTELV